MYDVYVFDEPDSAGYVKVLWSGHYYSEEAAHFDAARLEENWPSSSIFICGEDYK